MWNGWSAPTTSAAARTATGVSSTVFIALLLPFGPRLEDQNARRAATPVRPPSSVSHQWPKSARTSTRAPARAAARRRCSSVPTPTRAPWSGRPGEREADENGSVAR